MTFTIDSRNLTVTRFSEDVEVIKTEWDAWEDGAYKRKVKVCGTIRKWTLECIEENVAWADSAVKHLQDKAEAGNPVTWTINEGTTHSVNTDVYVLEVAVAYENTESLQDYRRFTLTLQEA